MNAITIRPFNNSKIIRETLAVLGLLFFLTFMPYEHEIWDVQTVHPQNGIAYDRDVKIDIHHGYSFSSLVPTFTVDVEIFFLELLLLSGLYLYFRKFSIFEKGNLIWKELFVIICALGLASVLLPTWTFSPDSHGMQFSGYDFLWNVHIHHLDFLIFYPQLLVSLAVLYFVRKRYSEQIQSWLLK